eukprot:jgi/Picre1/27175/NNA_000144.t1
MAEDNVQHHDIEKERPQRRKLHLKPRDPEAAARIEAGAVAGEVGKSEEDILKEEVQKEKLHLRLTPAQHEEKKSHEAAVKEIEDQIEKESDEKKKDLLRVELRARVETLDALMERFVAMTLENAKSGDVPRVSQLRKVQHEMHQHERGGLGWFISIGISQRSSILVDILGSSIRVEVGVIRHGVEVGVGLDMFQRQWMVGGMVEVGLQNGRIISLEGGGGGGGGGDDAGAVMYPEYSAHRGGRGGGGRQQLPPRDVFYQGPFPGRGVGGEIEFDSFSDQDRY